MATQKKPALGRGLDALISTGIVKTEGSSYICEVPLSQITANPGQPRREFDEERLAELSESIRELGIIQPITLRKTAEKEYQIIAGERRFRAASMAGLESVPAYIRTAHDENAMEMALIENIQREDLNALEVALACQNLIEVYSMTQEQLSRRIGKKRATIANYVRLLKLPAEIQMALKEKEIEMGHARALLSIENPLKQLQLFHELKARGYSVRKVEERAKEFNEPGGAKVKKSLSLPDGYVEYGKQLSDRLETKVKLHCTEKGKGSIDISFKNEKEFKRIMALLEKL